MGSHNPIERKRERERERESQFDKQKINKLILYLYLDKIKRDHVRHKTIVRPIVSGRSRRPLGRSPCSALSRAAALELCRASRYMRVHIAMSILDIFSDKTRKCTPFIGSFASSSKCISTAIVCNSSRTKREDRGSIHDKSELEF